MIDSYKDIKGKTGKLAKREPFKGNSLRAGWTRWLPNEGQLNNKEWAMLTRDWAEAADANLPLYVVYSYKTPIAWAIEGQNAYCTPQKFSSTTSKGQSIVRQWIDYSNQEA